ncbi:MAG: LacI family DNA-binding transcriptional regulator [Hamadaea sp.]|uniref:LacI family DNA-binding transcriptional regulator n=1 Tax=Hamadaea sp. TaxID=2024425 RepID=UPI00183C1735|nr:LacI family DNA-binding transcriptional regulator [Hamadaea sp.]NUR70346.1 LacI family DNA-binding transcriptional regulator [Hamadaea sp.]NUT21932.1 LacI family DNA-binding transcriptional regulator [Hamadaea sp.]
MTGRNRRSGMREVAQAAGVSVSTVANVLSRPAIVAPETRQRVEAAIAGVGYVPHGPARQLRGVPSPMVGSITLDLANPFYAEVNRGIEDRLAPEGCLLLAGSTDLREDKETRLLRLLQAQAVRGVIISPFGTDLSRLLALSRQGTPVVLVDHPGDGLGLCAVGADDVLGGRLAGEHLLALGHRRIAYLGDSVNPAPVAGRREGLRQALAGFGLDPSAALLDLRLQLRPPSLTEAAAAAAEQILSASPPVTAVVCLNDTAALGLLDGLEDQGVRVPQDLSVVGYDDLSFARRLTPPLTTVRQSPYRLGETAADLLLDEARDRHEHRQVRLEPELVVRASTAPPYAP